MSYTINPNAKNKWARNAENTMDLSLETDASSVYLDNGRTLEQEIGEGSMVSNVTTVDSAVSKIINGTLDGAYESCVFKGKSLVNLMTSCKDEYVVRYHDPSNPNYTVANISMMKPNTEYTLFYKAKYRLEGDGAGERGTLHIATSVEQGFIGASHNLTTEYKQYVFKLTTTSTVDCFTFKSNGSYFAIKECVLLEGDYTNQDVPFFEGLCDSKMPILRNVSNEAFCHDSLEGGSISGNNGGNISSTNPRARTKDMKKLNEATSILFSDNLLGVEKYVFSYDSNKRYLGRTPTNWETGNEIKPVEGAYYYRVVFTKYLEELPRSMYIIPKNHKTNILRTSEEIVLRKVGGVCDTYNPLTGEYVQRIGEVVLDGSENWWETSIEGQTIKRFRVNFISKRNNSNQILICDGILSVPNSEWNVDREQIEADGKILSIRKAFDTVEDFKTWLSQNPLTVQYVLVEPITTIVESLTTPFTYENGHIILESGYEGQSLLPTLEYSTVVNKTGLVENVAKTIQRQEKQLTMLEKMLIQNIINLDYNNTLLTLKNEMEEML